MFLLQTTWQIKKIKSKKNITCDPPLPNTLATNTIPSCFSSHTYLFKTYGSHAVYKAMYPLKADKILLPLHFKIR
jgi:hypothetical protein